MSDIEKLVTEQIKSGKLLIRKTESGELEIVDPRIDRLPSIADTYKDRLFRMIFKEKKDFLMLYNAMNDTHYNNPEDLSLSTLENAIYMGMKNDVSFVLYDRLLLYEHQSTKNPNMPLRSLFYAADIYSELVKDKNIYGTKLIKIPEPKFVVFYNGAVKLPAKTTLKLSDMYENVSGQVSLELVTEVYNINLGYNQELMKKCRTLHDYAVFVDLVRRYQKEMPLKLAMSRAIDECIASGILANFLKKNKAEVLKMGLYEYDEEMHIQMEREDARLEERHIGIVNFIELSQELGASLEDTIQRLMTKYSLTEEDAKKYVTQHWEEA